MGKNGLFIGGEGRLSSCGSAPSYLPQPGLLSHGEGLTQLNTPTRLPSTLGGELAVSVSAKVSHSIALTADGAVWSWGDGACGQLGHGDQQAQLLPRKVQILAGNVVAVKAGNFHSLALTSDGAVWSWGTGADGRLGHGDRQRQLLPKKVEALAGQRVVAVSSGGIHSLAITADGAAWSWGFHGRLGPGVDEQHQLLPKKIEAFAGQRVVAVSAGAFYSSLTITADGAVWSWGHGREGRLGHGDEQQQLLPKKVEAFAGMRVVAVSAGDTHSIARTADGAVFIWGKGEYGCLGHAHGEDLSNQLLPKEVQSAERTIARV